MSQIATLGACFAVAMSCGTLYVYSAYAPQLSERLGLSAAAISSVGMVGNLAMMCSGPFAGRVVDRYGFAAPLIVSAVATFSGYTLVRIAYINELSNLPVLVIALFLVGVGATFAFSATVKCAAVNFPRTRGFATALAMAGYGLSAFVMSFLGNWLAPGDTVGLLQLLSFVPACLAILFGPIVVLKQPKNNYRTVTSMGMRQFDSEYIGLATLDSEGRAVSPAAPARLVDRITENSGSGRHGSDIHGAALLKSRLFWSYAAILGILAGIGQCYIYTCGYMVKALAIGVDERPWQAQQVAYISLANCFGRICAGVVSDFLKSQRITRTYTLLIAAFLCFGSQLGASNTVTVDRMWIPSVLAGAFYGFCYGSYPGVISEAFGIRYFSSNWGLVALAPAPMAQILTLRMSSTYDAHVVDGVCEGPVCFAGAFRVHAALAVVAGFLVIYTARRLER